MVNPSGVFVFFLKLGLQAFHNSEESTETPEDTTVSPTVDKDSEPMKLYWNSDIEEHENKHQPYINIFEKNIGLDRIPDTTKEPIKELKYDFDALSQVYLPDALKTINVNAVPEAPKAGTGISNSGQNPSIVVGIVIGVLTGVIIVGALIAAIVYKHYVHHNVTSMNFDNPVYRKTTEDQFALEKNGYAPGSKLYPSTVGEEAQEPLNTPGTNDFV